VTCSIHGCGGKVVSWGLCHKHYLQTPAQRERRKRSYLRDKGKQSERAKAYRAIHRERLNQYNRDYRKKNAERIDTVNREWKKRPENRIKIAQRSARDRGLEWSISLDEFRSLVSLPCHYCSGSTEGTGAGLDRIDNSLGYSVSNVLPCCTACNKIRGEAMSVYEAERVIAYLMELRREA
jgi:hypothetical protein